MLSEFIDLESTWSSWSLRDRRESFAICMDWRFCIQMCTVYCIYNVISIHHPNRITIYEMYLFTGGESGRRAGWPRSRSDGEHHGEAAPSLLTNGLPSNLRRPVRPPSDQVKDLALLPPWWVLSFCIFISYFFPPRSWGRHQLNRKSLLRQSVLSLPAWIQRP